MFPNIFQLQGERFCFPKKRLYWVTMCTFYGTSLLFLFCNKKVARLSGTSEKRVGINIICNMLSDCEALQNLFQTHCLTVCAADTKCTPLTSQKLTVRGKHLLALWLGSLSSAAVLFFQVFKHHAVNVFVLSARPIISLISPPHSEPLVHQELLIMNVWSDVCLPSHFLAATLQPFSPLSSFPAWVTWHKQLLFACRRACVCALVCVHIYCTYMQYEYMHVSTYRYAVLPKSLHLAAQQRSAQSAQSFTQPLFNISSPLLPAI